MDPSGPPRRHPPGPLTLESLNRSQNGTSNGIPGSSSGPSKLGEEFTEVLGHDERSAPLGTDEQIRQLEMIDMLQDLGIDYEGVDLPRLVIYGDQLSRKSSVLGAIIKIPFPRQA
jgi:hypothetical protein